VAALTEQLPKPEEEQVARTQHASMGATNQKSSYHFPHAKPQKPRQIKDRYGQACRLQCLLPSELQLVNPLQFDVVENFGHLIDLQSQSTPEQPQLNAPLRPHASNAHLQYFPPQEHCSLPAFTPECHKLVVGKTKRNNVKVNTSRLPSLLFIATSSD